MKPGSKPSPSSRPAVPERAPTEHRLSARHDIEDFLDQVRSAGQAEAGGRLIFALDATMSRQPTWDRACALQADMFTEAASLGGLAIKLVFFRGIGECKASRWVGESAALKRLMGAIDCRGGHTQLVRVLQHARSEAAKGKVGALVLIGDAMEEKMDDVCAAAGDLALYGVPVFAFQEGYDRAAARAFAEIARVTHGAVARFDHSAAGSLRSLLRAAAAFAAGGRPALEDFGRREGGEAAKLLAQLR